MNYNKWSGQAVFNKVAKHLITQNKKAIKDGCCVLFDEESGRQCAVGCLIPKNQRKLFPNNLTFPVIEMMAKKHYGLLQMLQACHDKSRPSRWRSRLKNIAKMRGLKIPTFLEQS